MTTGQSHTFPQRPKRPYCSGSFVSLSRTDLKCPKKEIFRSMIRKGEVKRQQYPVLGNLVLLGKETHLVGNHLWASADCALMEFVFVISDVGNSGTSVDRKMGTPARLRGLSLGSKQVWGSFSGSLLWLGNLAT